MIHHQKMKKKSPDDSSKRKCISSSLSKQIEDNSFCEITMKLPEGIRRRTRGRRRLGDDDEEKKKRKFLLLKKMPFFSPSLLLVILLSLHQLSSSNAIELRHKLQKRHTTSDPGPRRREPTSSNNNVVANPNNKRQVIHATLKGQVNLPCNLQPADPNDAVSLVLWYKDNSMVPIFSLDARSSSVHEARHKPGAWLEGRSSLKIYNNQQPDSESERTIERRRRRQAPQEDSKAGDLDSMSQVENNEQPTIAGDDAFVSSDEADALETSNRRLWLRRRRRGRRRGGEDGEEEEEVEVEGEGEREGEEEKGEANGSLLEFGQLEHDDRRSLAGGLGRFPSDGGGKRKRRHQTQLQSEPVKYSSNPSAAEEGMRQLHRQRMASADDADDESAGGERAEELLDGRAMALVAPRAATGSNEQQQQQQLIGELSVDSLSSEDNGIYICRVDFRRARSRTQEFVLKIIVPAEKPIIRDLTQPLERHVGVSSAPNVDQAQESQVVVGPYNEGARLVLECETQGGYPTPTLSWWRDGRLVDDSYEIVSASTGQILERRVGGNGETSLEKFSTTETTQASQDSSLLAGKEEQTSDEKQWRETGGAGGNQSNQFGPQTTPPAASVATHNKVIRNRLELEALRRQDLMANYSCQAWNTKLAEAPTSSAMIDMNLRPIKVQIDNERRPVLADKPIEIVCRAFGSRPAARISWWRNGQRLESAATSGGGERVVRSNQVRIQETSASSGGFSGNATTTSSSTLTFVPQLNDSGTIISCRAENPHLTSSFLQLNEQSNNNNNNILLNKDNTQANSIEDSWKLEVHYFPRVSLALGDKLRDSPIKEGHDVYFECSVDAQPMAHEIRWWFDNVELETNLAAGIIISNQSLVLQRVQRKQRGRYTCSAVNTVGEALSNKLYLRVQYAPFCRDQQRTAPASSSNNRELDPLWPDGGPLSQQRFKTHYGAARMESVKVYCHVDADPRDSMAYKWAFVAAPAGQPTAVQSQKQAQLEFSGQQLVYLDSSQVSRVEEEPLVSIASYTPRSELDYGSLLCWAENALGPQSEPCVYHIVPAERPDPVRNCRLLNASDTQLSVGCEPGYDGGVDQSFQMEVYDSQRRQLVANVSSSSINQLTLATNKLLGSLNNSNNSSSTDSPQEGALQQSEHDDSTANKQQQEQQMMMMDPPSLAEPQVSRQQKQRHSSQQQHQTGGEPSKSSQQRIHPLETVFITEPNLEPATDYFLSIYSSNSKGSSKPVAFTATTMNFSSSQESSSSSMSAEDRRELWNTRDARRSTTAPSSSSHLLSDVLALSWNPFILVCAISVALFIMFGSITFALMKYVDFSSSDSMRGSRGTGAGGGANTNTNSDADSSQAGASSSNCSDLELSACGTKQKSKKKKQGGVRVVTLATNEASKGEKAHNLIALNGMVTFDQKQTKSNNNNNTNNANDSPSLLSGSYLRLKLQQLTTNNTQSVQTSHLPQVALKSALKQSNSDNFLNQPKLQHHQSTTLQRPNQNSFQQHQHFQPPYVGGALCGTLPKDITIMPQHSLLGGQLHQCANGENFQLQSAAGSINPYGYLKATFVPAGSSSSPDATGTTYSVSTNTSTTSGANRSNAPLLLSEPKKRWPGGQIEELYRDQQQNTSATTNYLLHDGCRVEQLIINGMQYVHQTPPNNIINSNNNNNNNHTNQYKNRHLHLTGADWKTTGAAYGSLQRPNSVSATNNNNNIPLYSMQDYHGQQEQICMGHCAQLIGGHSAIDPQQEPAVDLASSYNSGSQQQTLPQPMISENYAPASSMEPTILCDRTSTTTAAMLAMNNHIETQSSG